LNKMSVSNIVEYNAGKKVEGYTPIYKAGVSTLWLTGSANIKVSNTGISVKLTTSSWYCKKALSELILELEEIKKVLKA